MDTQELNIDQTESESKSCWDETEVKHEENYSV